MQAMALSRSSMVRRCVFGSSPLGGNRRRGSYLACATATPSLLVSPIPVPRHNLERKLGPVNMAAVRKVLHSGQRLLFIHRVASNRAAFRMTKMSAKYYSDTVTHTGQVSVGRVIST